MAVVEMATKKLVKKLGHSHPAAFCIATAVA